MTHIDGSLLRLVFRYPILAIGISAIVIGLLYLLDLENLLQPLTSLLSPVLSKWGLSHDVFGVINLVGGTAWILAF
jgi:energy-converting hydrogenase Eha subunit A